MALLLLAAATGFACATPVHRDGASLRCNDAGAVLRLQGVKVSPPGGPCFRPDDCPVDVGRMAQDQLAELTRGRKIMCRPAGRGTVRCTADGKDLSCAMLASGLAKPLGDDLGCPQMPRAKVALPKPASPIAMLEPWRNWIIGGLVALNLLTALAFLEDRRRLSKDLARVSDIHLLTLALFGGGLGGFVVQQTTGHLRDDEPFASQFVVLLGLQIGAAIGLFAIPIG
jgi:uncharacterized membrane protein YsdA (DUF1294 family)